MRSILALLIMGTLVGGAILVSGCGSKDPVVRPDGVVQSSNLPDWTRKTSWYEDGDKKFYAVGLYQGSRNPRTQRDQAALAARVEMTKFFQSKVSFLSKYYAATVMADDPNRVSDEQFNSEVNKAFGQMTLSGVAIEDTYYDPYQKVSYAKAVMKMDEFKNMINDMKTLSAGVKDAIRENAEKAFKELDKEIEKNQ